MSNISCPVCAKKIAICALICPQCGKIISEKERTKAIRKQKTKAFMGILFTLVIVGFVAFYLYDFKSKDMEKSQFESNAQDNIIAEDTMETIAEAAKQAKMLVVGFVTGLFSPVQIIGTSQNVGKPQPYSIIVNTVQRNYLTGKGVNMQRGRDKRQLIIALVQDKEGFTKEGLSHEDLIATVVEAARTHYSETCPVIDVRINTTNAKSIHATVTLARAVYIPDEKGYSGMQKSRAWLMLKAVERGISKNEQRYLSVWGEMLPKDQTFLESFSIYDKKVREAHDIAVSKYMNIEPKSLNPFVIPIRDYSMK